MTLTLPTFPGFNPEDYSVYGEYQHENFMFAFTQTSTVKDRVRISDTLATKIDAELDAAEAEASAKAAVAADEPGATTAAAAPARPWWEADPRFAGRFESVTPPDQDPGQ